MNQILPPVERHATPDQDRPSILSAEFRSALTEALAAMDAQIERMPDATELEHGVPLFLSQLSTTFNEQGTGGTDDSIRASRAA